MVVVIGGGFAGRMAAVRLRAAGAPVTLVDARDGWVERTRLHEAAARGRPVERPLRPWAEGIGATFVQGRARRLEDRAVLLEDGRELAFDAAVVAAGSQAVGLGGPEDAARLNRRVRALPDGARISVVGAGLTGIELATELAEAYPRLSVSLHGPLGGFSPRGRWVVLSALERLGVTWSEARVEGEPDADLVIPTTGFRMPAWLEGSGLPLDGAGRVRVDPSLAVVGLERVVAAGDCAATPLRMACATAMPMGCHAADTVIRTLRGQEPRPFRFGFALRCVSLGRRDAVVQLVDRHDAARPTAFGGAAGVFVKEAILRVVAATPEWEAGAGVPLYGWPRAEALA